MKEKKIVIDISQNGEIKAEAFGMVGPSCVEEINKLLKDLALETSSYKKPEYYQQGVEASRAVTVKKND